MTVGISHPARLMTTGIVVTRKRPGHFVALTQEGRIDAMLGVKDLKLAQVLERRAPITLKETMEGPWDLSRPLVLARGVKNLDPYDVSIVMPASDGEPVVSEADQEAWLKFRVAYDVTIEVPPFKVSGVLLLMSSQDPLELTERGSELFLPVFAPVVQLDGLAIKDTPRDAVLVNRSHMRRVAAVRRQ
jgi:hypothetical protein